MADGNPSNDDDFEHPSEDDIDVVDQSQPLDLDDVEEGDAVEEGIVDEEQRDRLIERGKHLEKLEDAREIIRAHASSPKEAIQQISEMDDDEIIATAERLRENAKQDSDAGEVPETGDDGTPVRFKSDQEESHDAGGDSLEDIAQEAGEAVRDDAGGGDTGQAGAMFDDDEVEQMSEQFDDFDLEAVKDIPDDFDYESQDTTELGGETEITIEHNECYFKLVRPEGMKEEKFWTEMQTVNNIAEMYEMMIRYAVERPKNIGERMEKEGWSTFTKVGLGMKCSVFLGVDDMQDF